ncbi:MAG: hypothetical protein HFH27_03835 [Clostridiaceae bacterium]|nr:hypothetical protein [Clostridiaceae bacterium]
MTTEKMTVHKALAELKTMDARISKAIGSTAFVVANKHSNRKINGKPVSEFCEQAVSAYKSASALIRRRDAIKRAVVLSNAAAKVVINGAEFTVAEAIEMKNHGVAYQQQLLDQLAADYQQAQAEADKQNGKALETRADAYLKDLFGSSDPKNLSEEVKKARQDFIESQTYELVDPVGAYREMERLEKEINDFMVEVDAALSVANALTEITVSY